jgi:hypothetical protein
LIYAGIVGTDLKESRWFTRGWTLQELIAPSIVEFYDTDVSIIGFLPIFRHFLVIHFACFNSQIFLKRAIADFTIF